MTESWKCWNGLFLSFAYQQPQIASLLPVQGINLAVLNSKLQSGIHRLHPGVFVERAPTPSAVLHLPRFTALAGTSLFAMLLLEFAEENEQGFPFPAAPGEIPGLTN